MLAENALASSNSSDEKARVVAVPEGMACVDELNAENPVLIDEFAHVATPL